MLELVTPDDVKTRMGLPADLLEADDSIESALVTAHEFISGLLDSPLEYASHTDMFYVLADYFPVVRGKRVRLRLSQFKVEDGSLTLSAGEDMTSLTAVDSSNYHVDLEKGVVHLDLAYIGYYVSVTYNAGIQTPSDAPFWLKEAILSYVPGVLNSMQITNRDDEYKTTIKDARSLAAGVLAPHMRGTAFHYRPMY